jgi:hypothetical protein
MADKKRTDAEMFDAILQEAELDRIGDEVASASDAQIRTDLAKDGITDDKLAAIAQAQRSLIQGVRKAKVRDIRTARRWPGLLVAASLGFASAACATLTLSKTDNLPVAFKPAVPIPTATATGSPNHAASLREGSCKLFFEHDYQQVLANLDFAKQLDPAGDNEVYIQNLRQEATERLNQQK